MNDVVRMAENQSECSHTPGPWVANMNFGRWTVRQDPKDWDGMGYQSICVIPAEPKGTHYGDMFKANARLIAAAPDLLAALKSLDTDWSSDMPRGPEDDNFLADSTRRIWRDMRAAIAKAEGRS